MKKLNKTKLISVKSEVGLIKNHDEIVNESEKKGDGALAKIGGEIGINDIINGVSVRKNVEITSKRQGSEKQKGKAGISGELGENRKSSNHKK